MNLLTGGSLLALAKPIYYLSFEVTFFGIEFSERTPKITISVISLRE